MKTYRTKYVIIMGLALLACGVGVLLTHSNEGNADELSAEETKAESVLERFIYALRDGDFETASSMCDTTSLQDYLDAYKQGWEKQSMKDSADFAAIRSIIANTTMSTDKMEELDGVCIIDYTLSMDDQTKRCQATVKKEEGEWKVAAITNEI